MPRMLLATKLFVPPARATLLPRPRLFDRLARGLAGKLTLIAAPAGFGKTTLLSAWHASAGPTAPALAWVSLDGTDNDPLSFWSYVLAALDGVVPGIGTAALALLQSPQPPPMDIILTGVVNTLAARPADAATGAVGREIVLVLEDYHVITTPAIHASLDWLLEYLPPHVHLVIATRADPALRLARLRASGAVTELRADDLRFTPDEVATLLNEIMGLNLTADDIAALAARTEGWIAGLQLAALSLHDRPAAQRADSIASFTGSHRYVVEYLLDEVLARQAAHVQAFLLATSILERLSGALCDAVVAGEQRRIEDSAGVGELVSSQALLEALERSNLFIVPLDGDRHWYRYHHLFADALRQRLHQRAPRTAVASLHGRASAWYEQHGLVADAVQHARAAADWPRVARLLEQYALPLIVGGQVHTVLDWMRQLPNAHLRSKPLLSIFSALALLFTNELDAAENRLQDAERTIGPQTPPAEAHITQGYAAAIRANLAQYTGDFARCVAYGEHVLAALPETEVIARTTAHLHVARAFRVNGDVTDAAERRARAAVAPIRATGSLFGTMGALANLARLHGLQGRLRAAATTYRALGDLAGGHDGLRWLNGSLAYAVGRGELQYEWNALDDADALVAQAIDLLAHSRTVDAEDVVASFVALSRLHVARGEHASAQSMLVRAHEMAQQRGFVPHLIQRVAAVQAQLALTTGDLPAAVAWADTSGLSAEDAISFPREAEYLTLARVWLAQAQHHAADSVLLQAFHVLQQLLDDATAKARMGSVLEILIVRALAYWMQGARQDALATIERALLLAEPEGYVRRFVDQGAGMESLLRAAATGTAPAYVARLLDAFGGGQADPSRVDTGAIDRRSYPSAPGNAAYEPGSERLSARELEVLRLIASGKSNAEIARVLVVAVSTVKSHINSIFGKLQVTSRSEAVVRARALQLI